MVLCFRISYVSNLCMPIFLLFNLTLNTLVSLKKINMSKLVNLFLALVLEWFPFLIQTPWRKRLKRGTVPLSSEFQGIRNVEGNSVAFRTMRGITTKIKVIFNSYYPRSRKIHGRWHENIYVLKPFPYGPSFSNLFKFIHWWG